MYSERECNTLCMRFGLREGVLYTVYMLLTQRGVQYLVSLCTVYPEKEYTRFELREEV